MLSVSVLSPRYQTVLQIGLPLLKLSGHTDNQGDSEKNLLLSEKRAKAIKKYLISKGLRQDMITVEWFGQTIPIADNTTEIGRQKNRRVEMKIDFKR